MNKIPKQFRLTCIVGIIATCLLVYACTEEIWNADHGNKAGTSSSSKDLRVRAGNKELTLEAAEEWYNANHPPVVSLRSSGPEAQNRQQAIRPDWNVAKESHRGRFEAVETPVKINGHRIMLDAETAEKWSPGTEEGSDFIRNAASIVILKDMELKTTRSFMAVFVGSYDYLQKKRIGKNSYLTRDREFDGSVYFFELDGTFVNGWKYSNGKIVATISNQSEESNQQVGPSLRTMQQYCHMEYATEWITVCEQHVYGEYDEEYGFSPVVEVECYSHPESYYYEVCEWYDDGYNDDYWYGGSNDENNSGGGYIGSNPNPPGSETNPDAPKKYVPSDTDKLAKKDLPLTMEKQFPNHCVTTIMEYINNKVFNGKKNEGDYLLDYHKQIKKNFVIGSFAGVDPKELGTFITNNFTVPGTYTVETAISKEWVVFGTIPAGSENVLHAVVIVGYIGSDYIYMDPAEGKMQTNKKNKMGIQNTYVISGVK